MAGFFRKLFRRKQAEPERAKPDQAEPQREELEQAEPEQAEPQREEPEQAQPEPAEPAQAKPEQAGPEQQVEAEPRVEVEPAPRVETEPEMQVEPEPRSEPEPQPEPQPVSEPEEASPAEEKRGFFGRLRHGLTKTSSRLSSGIAGIFTRRKLDEEMLQELEDILIQADLGLRMTDRIIERLRRERFDKSISPREVRAVMAEEIAKVLKQVEQPFEMDAAHRPFVVLVVGVNGSGKTTTIGKLAAIARREGHKVMLVAGDTFRAAAVEQLKIWAQRSGALFEARDTGADAAALAYDALEKARAEEVDVVFMDTAGRLQNRKELMDELAKIVRVMKKVMADAPHAVLLVLDATTGQNALNQVKVFREVADVTGLVMTKLDGTARGGILVAIAEQHGLPVHAIGVGEGIDDLQPFDAQAFAAAIAGVDEQEESRT